MSAAPGEGRVGKKRMWGGERVATANNTHLVTLKKMAKHGTRYNGSRPAFPLLPPAGHDKEKMGKARHSQLRCLKNIIHIFLVASRVIMRKLHLGQMFWGTTRNSIPPFLRNNAVAHGSFSHRWVLEDEEHVGNAA